MIAIFYPLSSILNRYVFFSSLLENPYMIGNYRCQLCLTQQVKSENIFSAYVEKSDESKLQEATMLKKITFRFAFLAALLLGTVSVYGQSANLI